jgi:protein associated with RNAse G/E
MSIPITIRKLNLNHEQMWSYSGHVLERTPTYIRLEARFNRPTTDYGYAVFEENDRFVEHFYADRWYNIFEIHAVQDDHLKGWYCNIVKPALFSANEIAQVDLALDVWIAPDGGAQVLDQVEFDALPLDTETRQQATAALNTLLDLLAQRAHPFHVIARPA